MNKPEQQFWVLLKKHLPGDVARVENIVDAGMPDVTGAYGGKDYWVELKVCSNKFKTRDVEKLLRPEQYVWHIRRYRHGSKVFVMVRYHDQIITYVVANSSYFILTSTYKIGNGFNWSEFEPIIKNEIICDSERF